MDKKFMSMMAKLIKELIETDSVCLNNAELTQIENLTNCLKIETTIFEIIQQKACTPELRNALIALMKAVRV